jgi:hypothetical protein
MIQLLLFSLVGVLLFVSFLILGFEGTSRRQPDSSAVHAVSQMVKLDGLSFPDPRRLLDDTEYLVLRSNPKLHRVAKRFRRERHELAILWVSSLLADLRTLRSFRKFLVRRGVRTNFPEELQIAQAYSFALILLNLLRVSIWIGGPFLLTSMTRRADNLVEKVSNGAASVLVRVPKSGWAEIERSWVKSVA